MFNTIIVRKILALAVLALMLGACGKKQHKTPRQIIWKNRCIDLYKEMESAIVTVSQEYNNSDKSKQVTTQLIEKIQNISQDFRTILK